MESHLWDLVNLQYEMLEVYTLAFFTMDQEGPKHSLGRVLSQISRADRRHQHCSPQVPVQQATR